MFNKLARKKYLKGLADSVLNAIARASNYKRNSIEYTTILNTIKADYDLLYLNCTEEEFNKHESYILRIVSFYYKPAIEADVKALFIKCKDFWANIKVGD